MNPLRRKAIRYLIGAMLAPIALIWDPQPDRTVQLEHAIHELELKQAKIEDLQYRQMWDISDIYAILNRERRFHSMPTPREDDSTSA